MQVKPWFIKTPDGRTRRAERFEVYPQYEYPEKLRYDDYPDHDIAGRMGPQTWRSFITFAASPDRCCVDSEWFNLHEHDRYNLLALTSRAEHRRLSPRRDRVPE